MGVLIALYGSHGLLPWQPRPALWRVLAAAALFGPLVSVLTALSALEGAQKGNNFSWLRPEIIKIPLWWKLLSPITPGFTVGFILLVSAFMSGALRRPHSHWLRSIPLVLTCAWLALIYTTISPLSYVADPTANQRFHATNIMYIVMFGGAMARRRSVALRPTRWKRCAGFVDEVVVVARYPS